MAIGFTLSPSLTSGTPVGAGGAAVGSGARRRHVLIVFWEQATSDPDAVMVKGGVAGTRLTVNDTIGSATRNGIHVWQWSETDIASMVGTALTASSGTYPAASGYTEYTLRDVDQADPDQTPGHSEGGSVTSLTLNNPSAEAAAFSVLACVSDSTSTTFTEPGGYTEVFDSTTGGPELACMLATAEDISASSPVVSFSNTPTRALILQLGYNELVAASKSRLMLLGVR